MRFKHVIIILSCLLFFHSNIYCQSKIATEGLFHKYSKWFIDSFEVNRLWFMDSAIIYELKVDVEYGEDDEVKYRGYEPYRYSYFDMRSKIFYDYNSFSDTATLIIKYKNEDEYGPSGFFPIKFSENLGNYQYMADTLFGGNKFKRIKFTNRKPEFDHVYEQIYYFNCNSYKTNLLSIYTVAEEYFPDCSLQQIDRISYDKEIISSVTDHFKIIRPYLEDSEKKIFTKWEKNAKTNTIPLSTIADMWKIPVVPIIFKNNPKYPMYN